MFLDTNNPRPPPPSPRPAPRRDPAAKRDEDILLVLILFGLLTTLLAPFCGGTLWDAVAALL
jgi:hypothetical protein